MKQVVYVVEDDADIRRLMQYQLEAAGYAVQVFNDGGAVLNAAAVTPPVLFVLDIMLPNGDGRELCRRIRRHPQLHATPVIFVSAKTTEADRLLGFEVGADDYIAKPFSPRELIARVRAVLRTRAATPVANVLSYGNVELNLDGMTLRVGTRHIEITATEFRLLEVLMKSPGHVFARQRLLEIVWGRDRHVDPRSVDVYMSRLRGKLNTHGADARYLRTVRGLGYYFRPEQRANSPRRSGGDSALTR